jgi:hypothetical protein
MKDKSVAPHLCTKLSLVHSCTHPSWLSLHSSVVAFLALSSIVSCLELAIVVFRALVHCEFPCTCPLGPSLPSSIVTFFALVVTFLALVHCDFPCVQSMQWAGCLTGSRVCSTMHMPLISIPCCCWTSFSLLLRSTSKSIPRSNSLW